MNLTQPFVDDKYFCVRSFILLLKFINITQHFPSQLSNSTVIEVFFKLLLGCLIRQTLYCVDDSFQFSNERKTSVWILKKSDLIILFHMTKRIEHFCDRPTGQKTNIWQLTVFAEFFHQKKMIWNCLETFQWLRFIFFWRVLGMCALSVQYYRNLIAQFCWDSWKGKINYTGGLNTTTH